METWEKGLGMGQLGIITLDTIRAEEEKKRNIVSPE